MPSESSGAVPVPGLPFQVWLRRDVGGDASFSVRFEAKEGRSALRVARGGVVFDPPLRAAGEERGLSPGQLWEARLLHLGPNEAARRSYSFGRIPPAVLLTLPAASWLALEVVEEAGARSFRLPGDAGRRAAELEDEPTSPQRLLAAFHPPPRGEVTRPRPAPDEEPTELPEGVLDAALSSVVNLAVRPVPGAARPAEGGAARAARPDAPARPAAPAAPASAEPPPERTDPAGVAERTDTGAGPEAFHARPTTLVRYFRRRLQERELQLQELEAKLRTTGRS